MTQPEELAKVLSRALKKAYSKRFALVEVFEEFLSLFRLVKAWVSGAYRQTPRKVILWAIVAILYFLSPIDFFPDLFPGGYIDDIAVIHFIIRRIKSDLDQFRAWESSQK